MNKSGTHEQMTRIEDIERAAWFARLALGTACPEPLPNPSSESFTPVPEEQDWRK